MNVRKGVSKIRKAVAPSRAGRSSRVSETNWEELLDRDLVVSARAKGRPTVDEVLDALRARDAERGDAAGELSREDVSDAAIVIGVSSGRCTVVHHGRTIDVIVPSEIARRQKSALTVGDRVLVDDREGTWRIRVILPRWSVLSRPDPGNPHMQRLVAANIDVVIHVSAVKSPPLRPRLIDRYLIAIQRGGAEPLLCLNKSDLLDPAERAEAERATEPYRALGVEVIFCSVETGEGLDRLRDAVQGRTSALVGHSGVGKSSILNRLDERLELATGGLHKRGTGRHTTTRSTLYDFGDDTYLIDTPGIREFGLSDLDVDSLRDYFPEFEEGAVRCRFNDCTHLHEPQCEVKRLVEEGTLSRARYDAYVRLDDDLRNPQ
jgi:ribosome biogenesis GTPase